MFFTFKKTITIKAHTRIGKTRSLTMKLLFFKLLIPYFLALIFKKTRKIYACSLGGHNRAETHISHIFFG